MGLPTDSYIDVEISGDVVDRIGLSASLTDISEIISGGYCGMHHLLWRNGQTKTTDADYTVSKTIPVELSGNTFPITVSKGHGAYNYPDGMFCGIVWLYSENSPMDYCINSSNISDYKLVTEWDAPHYVYKPSPLNEAAHWTGKTHLSWADNDMAGYVWNNGYNNNFMRLEYWDDNDGTNVVNINHIRPYLMYQNENGSQFLSIYDYSYQATFFYADTDTYAATTTLKDYTDSENIAFCVAIESLGSPDILPATGSSYGFINADGMSVDDQFGVYMLTSSSSISGHSGYFAYGTEYAFHFKDDVFTDIAGCGLKFYTDKLYKPIISGGVVVGYTDDMDEESELDEWTGTTDHGIGPTPPTPPAPEGDDIDPNSFGGGSKLGGVDNIWLLTAQQLSDLHTAFNNNSDPNFEPLNSIISVLGLAISPLYIFGDDISTVTNITIKKADGTSWSSGVNGHICSSQVSSFGLTGNISIRRKYNNFLDYPPYASHEMFIPLCGWVPLPSCCVGRSLSVYYVPDIQTGGVRGLVLCDGCIVAEKYGILGANIPFTSNGHGLMLGGIISGGVQTLADFATAMGGLATGNAMATVYGGSSFFSDGFNMALAANQNRTSVIGQNQDRTGFSDGTYIRIKSVYQDVKIDPLFGHTIGYMCHESGQLNNFHGFTVCENPHVHISATSSEKEEIKRLLEEGVILP